KPTTTAVVTQDCGVCHAPPATSTSAGWAANRSGMTPALYHASLTAAAVAQPGYCVDCHANSRPNGGMTVPSTNLVFDHTIPAATRDCATCHQGSAPTARWSSWAGGKYHLTGDATPATCLPCHAGERPTSTTNWKSTTYASAPFDYGTNAQGITHGAGQDCVVCHGGPGTGVWGSSQNWVGGTFLPAARTMSSNPSLPGDARLTTNPSTPSHATQRPDLQPGTNAALINTLLGFDHSANGTGDCSGCHQATVTANRYQTFFNITQKNSGDWKGGQAY